MELRIFYLASLVRRISISPMKAAKWIAAGLSALVVLLSTSCGSLPETQKDLGPQSEHSSIPWNRQLQGEGTAGLGGFSGTP